MGHARRLLLIQSPLGGKGEKHPSADAHAPIETRDETLFENPQFKHYEETSNIQLFFDLFFVANLTSFTEQHEVNSTAKLSSYIGFFCILWFTWCQVTLYDVRFATDSIMERVAHVCHFGVMLGLAVVGPQFDDPRNHEDNWTNLQQLSLILMVSRIVLFFQYGLTAFFSWRYRTTRIPLLIVMGSLASAAFIYFGLSFAFSEESSKYAFVAWYVVCVFEVGANIAVAGLWPVVSFRDTHLTERMTCLTLIILGEGVIGLTKSIVKIEKLDYDFSSTTIGTLVAAGFLIYLIYQLYFDNVDLGDFGSIPQQIWTFLHFPFHIALALVMEGANQFVSFRHINEYVSNVLEAPFNALGSNSTQADFVNACNDAVNTILDGELFSLNAETYASISNDLTEIGAQNATQDLIVNKTIAILLEVYQAAFNGYGFEPPESANETTPVDPDAALNEVSDKYGTLFNLIFEYFYICAGLVLIFIAIFTWLSRGKNTRRSRLQYIGIVSNFVLGVGLALLTTMVLTDAAGTLGASPWSLPVVVFVLFIAIVLNHVPRYLVKAPEKDEEEEEYNES